MQAEMEGVSMRLAVIEGAGQGVLEWLLVSEGGVHVADLHLILRL